MRQVYMQDDEARVAPPTAAVVDAKPALEIEVVARHETNGSAPEPSVVAVRMAGEIDLATAEPALLALRVMIADTRPVGLIIDMAGVDFFDCRGLNVLLTLDDHLKDRGGFLRIVRPSRAVRLVLDVTGHDGDLIGGEVG